MSESNKLNRFGIIAVTAILIVAVLGACAGIEPIDQAAETTTETTNEAATETSESESAAEVEASSEAKALPAIEDMETYRDVPVGFTDEGFPFRGHPDAPVTMYEYSDFQCPFCNRYFVQTEPAINEAYVRDGTLKVIFRDFPLVQLHPNAPAAHMATLCAADQGAPAYWALHDEIFRSQDEWSSVLDPDVIFARLAEEVELDMEQYSLCVESGEKSILVDEGVAEARAIGFSGTPSFLFVSEETGDSFQLVGAQPYDQFATWIDSIVAGEAPATAQAEEEDSGDGQIPYWATAEGLMPDPDRPGFNMAGDEYRGNPDAPVTVVEFSDFQCPFCKRHTEQTQPALDSAFVDTDEVMWVFKHFPLNIHPEAPMAGAASECAADQGMFWEMHHLIFANTDRWASDTEAGLTELASELGLDMDAFSACLVSEEAMARVNSDLNDGAAFVQGTPTFIVLYNGEGRIIPGALPEERFAQVIQQILDEAE
jgi:protein-disulfide isomerase